MCFLIFPAISILVHNIKYVCVLFQLSTRVVTSLARTTVCVELVARRTNATVNETIMEVIAKVCDVIPGEHKRYNTICMLVYDTSSTIRFQI